MKFVNISELWAQYHPPPLIITRPPGYFTLALDIDNWTGFETLVEWYPEFAMGVDGYTKWYQLPPITDGTFKTEHHPKNLNINYAYRYKIRTKFHISRESDDVLGGLPTKYVVPPEGIDAHVITDLVYTFQIQDALRVVEGENAATQTFIVPPSDSTSKMPVPFAINDVIEVYQKGVGAINIVGGSIDGISNVIIRSDGDRYFTFGQYATIGLRQRDLNEWVLSGDLI